MQASQRLDLLLNEIEMSCDPAIGGEQCNRFSIDCLLLIRDKLPPLAAQGLTLMSDYLDGRVSLAAITEMLVKCWQYLKETHNDDPLSNPEVSAIRAVIFPLDAQKHPEKRDIVDHLSFFLMLVNNVEPHFEEEDFLLRKHFSDCLSAPTDTKQ